MSFFIHKDQIYPAIYRMDRGAGQLEFSHEQLFNDRIQKFIKTQFETIYAQKENLNQPTTFFSRGGACKHVNFGNPAGTPYSSNFEQKKRANQVRALVTAIFALLWSVYQIFRNLQKKNELTEEIATIEGIRDLLPILRGHNQLGALHNVIDTRLKALYDQKSYVHAKLAIVISTLASSVFLAAAAITAPEWIAIGTLMVVGSLLTAVFTWTYAYFDSAPEKYSKIVKQNLEYLSSQFVPEKVSPQPIF